MKKESMTPLERWLAVFKREKPDRVPMDYWSTEEVTQNLCRYFGVNSRSEMLRMLHVDYVVSMNPKYIGPPLQPGFDVYGVQHAEINFGAGKYSEPVTRPLEKFKTVEEIEEQYSWPDPDWWDYSGLANSLRGFEEYPISGGGSEPFLIYKNLRGQELAMMDLVDNPEIVSYCLEKLFSLAYENTVRIYEEIPGRVTYSYVAEDMGGQSNLMISPKHIRNFLVPGMKRMVDLAHSAGAFAFHHNDGNIIQILPDMIDINIDILNPIQWRSNGMNRQFLKNTYGDKVIFHGAVDNQYTLPFGTTNEVREEVLENLSILGAGGGYILAPCHNIQPITPVENILAMYETGYHEGWT
jgi:uroporphyrinogen decarboxylase